MFILDLIIGLILLYVGVRWCNATTGECVDCWKIYKEGYRNTTYFALCAMDWLFSIVVLVWSYKILSEIQWAI